jgi:hypothetical protein
MDIREKTLEGPRMQQWNKEPRPKTAAMRQQTNKEIRHKTSDGFDRKGLGLDFVKRATRMSNGLWKMRNLNLVDGSDASDAEKRLDTE